MIQRSFTTIVVTSLQYNPIMHYFSTIHIVVSLCNKSDIYWKFNPDLGKHPAF